MTLQILVLLGFALTLCLPGFSAIDAHEILEIESYLRTLKLQGTWKERAIKAAVRIENSQTQSFLPQELEPEIHWMIATLLGFEKRSPQAGIYKKLASAFEVYLTHQVIRFSDLYLILCLFSEAVELSGGPHSEPKSTLLCQWSDNPLDPRLGNVSSKYRSIPWPVLPVRPDPGKLGLSLEDFIELLPFRIVPLELTLTPVFADEEMMSPSRSLVHDFLHGEFYMMPSWEADAVFLKLWQRGRLPLEPSVEAVVRTMRRELVLQLQRLPKNSARRREFILLLFRRFHEPEGENQSLFKIKGGEGWWHSDLEARYHQPTESLFQRCAFLLQSQSKR